MTKETKVTKKEMLKAIKAFADRNRYLPKDFYDSVKDRDEEILKRVTILLYIFKQKEKDMGADKMQEVIVDYKNYIAKQMEINYSQNTLKKWIKKTIVDAENLISTWKSLSDSLNNNLINTDSPKINFEIN